ncbi:hypothetical protein [Rhizobium leguminosarum]|uniref:hypothetical protein n=1 Tax=Rhizobium TaxID=379 RepID=UPI001FDFFBDB|nr:hypothetical protein [Rhizobium leguminosarum]
MQGIGAAIGSFLLLPLASFDLADTVSGSEVLRFVGWALVMGLAGSWLATWFWVFASRRLPLALAAQLIVAETVFGLAYGFSSRGVCHLLPRRSARHCGLLASKWPRRRSTRREAPLKG